MCIHILERKETYEYIIIFVVGVLKNNTRIIAKYIGLELILFYTNVLKSSIRVVFKNIFIKQ